MIYSIENSELQVKINSIGAELCSIVSKRTGSEYMWEGDESIWGSTAPVLFPIIGSLKGNVYRYRGKEYSLPKHGFIRHNRELNCRLINNCTVEFKYKSNNSTLLMFPFEFEFSIIFKLEKNKIRVLHEVVNPANDKLLFSIGGHPAFRCPLSGEESMDDYFIEFETGETDCTCLLDSRGLVTDKCVDMLDNSRRIPLNASLFENDALIFKHLKSRKVSLRNLHSSRAVILHFPDFHYLGLWSKPGAPFVCIEPWLGISDHVNSNHDFEQKEGIISLAAQSVFKAGYSIEIVE